MDVPVPGSRDELVSFDVSLLSINSAMVPVLLSLLVDLREVRLC